MQDSNPRQQYNNEGFQTAPKIQIKKVSEEQFEEIQKSIGPDSKKVIYMINPDKEREKSQQTLSKLQQKQQIYESVWPPHRQRRLTQKRQKSIGIMDPSSQEQLDSNRKDLEYVFKNSPLLDQIMPETGQNCHCKNKSKPRFQVSPFIKAKLRINKNGSQNLINKSFQLSKSKHQFQSEYSQNNYNYNYNQNKTIIRDDLLQGINMDQTLEDQQFNIEEFGKNTIYNVILASSQDNSSIQRGKQSSIRSRQRQQFMQNSQMNGSVQQEKRTKYTEFGDTSSQSPHHQKNPSQTYQKFLTENSFKVMKSPGRNKTNYRMCANKNKIDDSLRISPKSTRKTQQAMRNNKMILARGSKLDNDSVIKKSLFNSINENASQKQIDNAHIKSITSLSNTAGQYRKVPTHFYKNFKTNQIRESVEKHEQYNEDFLEQCNCKEHIQTREHTRAKSLSRSQSPRDKSLARQIKESSQNLHQPYVPCRKSCSTNHSPKIYHHKKNLNNNQSTSKLLLIKTKLVNIPDKARPMSQDTGMKKRREAILETDWQNSQLYQLINPPTNLDLQEQQTSCPKHSNRNTISQDIYQETEVKYMFSLLKRSIDDKEVIKKEELKDIFNKAKRTLKFEMEKLLLAKTYLSIEDKYDSHGESPTNIIKLLLRCQKMYDAQTDVKSILKNIIRREKQVSSINQNNNKDQIESGYNQILNISHRLYNEISRLQNEYKNLKRPFIYEKEEYKQRMINSNSQLKKALENKFDLNLEKKMSQDGSIQQCNKQLKSE